MCTYRKAVKKYCRCYKEVEAELNEKKQWEPEMIRVARMQYAQWTEVLISFLTAIVIPLVLWQYEEENSVWWIIGLYIFLYIILLCWKNTHLIKADIVAHYGEQGIYNIVESKEKTIIVKDHKGEIISCLLAVIGVVLGLLVMVYIFEKCNIHVPGSREMWLGVIGSILGGSFTLFGVLITVYKQKDSEREQRRLENMPILEFKVCYNAIEAENVLTCLEGELVTSAFSIFETKVFATIEIRSVNSCCAFNFEIVGCAINGKEIPHGQAFAPARYRVTEEDVYSFAFDCDHMNNNAFVLIRYSYEDIFGNKYYQDLPITYDEMVDIQYAERNKQIIEVRDLKQPILDDGNVKKLEEVAKCYSDYNAFCSK